MQDDEPRKEAGSGPERGTGVSAETAPPGDENPVAESSSPRARSAGGKRRGKPARASAGAAAGDPPPGRELMADDAQAPGGDAVSRASAASRADARGAGSAAASAEGEGMAVPVDPDPANPEAPAAPEVSPDHGPPAASVPAVAGGRLAFFALALAVLAVLGTSMLWWQYRAFYVELSDDDTALTRSLEDTRASLRRLDDALQAAVRDLATSEAQTAALGTRVDALDPRFAQLDQRIDALQGGTDDARQLWLRAEAEYYLAAATTELEIGGRWQNAIAALELADALLRELGNPALNAVRAEIAAELAALRAVRLPDVEGLTYALASLAERVDDLPMRADSPENFSPAADDLESMEPGLARLWRGVREALVGIVRIERRSDPVEVVLTEEERRVVRRQLELELELARVALARGRPQAFVTSLDAAAALLERDFDRGAPAVASALSTVADARRANVAPARPDISRSLNLLRAAPQDDR